MTIPRRGDGGRLGWGALQPVDLEDLLARDPAPLQYVHAPYIPVARRVWASGPAESGKSLWALMISCELSRGGRRVAYFSEENPVDEDIRRLRLLRPDPSGLFFFTGSGVDLSMGGHVHDLRDMATRHGIDLFVFDTLTACWSGDEESNRDVVALDRGALTSLVTTGASVLMLDHVGHPSANGPRRGVNAPRGASAKGQKADIVLEFRPAARGEFTVHVGKFRAGTGERPRDATFRIVDLPDVVTGAQTGIKIRMLTGAEEDAETAGLADGIVAIVVEHHPLTTNDLRSALRVAKVRGGRERQNAAMDLLRRESPPRVVCRREKVDTKGGRQDAEIWSVAEPVDAPGDG